MSGKLFLQTALFAFATAVASAQTFPFQLLATQASNAVTVQNGGTLQFDTTVGGTQSATVSATYVGSGVVTISQAPQVLGSTAFTATSSATFPLTLSPGESFSFNVQFMAASGSVANAQVSVPYSETTSASGTSATNIGTISLSLQGIAPVDVLSYILQSDNNVVPLQPGGTIPFPSTQVGSTSVASLNITNTGSGPGTITGITISGSAFKFSGLPLLPTTIAAGATLQVLIIYTPSGLAADAGQLMVTLDSGAPITVNLKGNGSSASFTYQLLQTNPPTSIAPGGTIAFPGTVVGQTSSVTLRILNSGNANGVLSSVSISGQAFQLASTLVLPQTLAPNASVTLTIAFAPTQPAIFTGALFVNSDSFTLTGTGLGPQLTFSYTAAGTAIAINSSNPAVVFSPVAVGQSGTVTVNVQNTGTQVATISNIGIGETPSPFSVSGVPPLPLTLQPGSSFNLLLTFTPTAVGFTTGTLRFDSTVVPLIGSGTQPPALPSYTITGLSATLAPMSQPSVGLTLASPYPVALTGTLTLSVSGSLPADPAVQFASGGLTVPFTIPANTTHALFANQSQQVFLQTGTVASTITITPAFATQAGGIALTPASPQTSQGTVPLSAPTIIEAQASNQSSNQFALTITGYTTTRSLSSLTLQFTAAAGFNIPTTQVSADLTQASAVWFGSATSQSFGGQFSLTVPVTLQSTSSLANLLAAISGLSVTVTNAAGMSNSLQVTVQ